MNHRHSLAGGAPGKRAFFPRRNPCPLANLPLHARCTTFSASLHHHWQRQFLLWSAPLPCVAPPAVDPRIVVRASRAPAVGRLLSTVSMSCLRSLALLMSSLSPCKEGKRAMTVCMQCVPRACVDWIAFFYFCVMCWIEQVRTLSGSPKYVWNGCVETSIWQGRWRNVVSLFPPWLVVRKLTASCGKLQGLMGSSHWEQAFSLPACRRATWWHLLFSQHWKRQEHRLIHIACRKAFHRDCSGSSVI